MYNYKIKAIFSITLLLATYYPGLVQAMQEGSTLTEIAEEKEKSEKIFISPQGLIYRKTKTVKQRIPHIKLHLIDNIVKPRHTFFQTSTVVYNDIIGFIDIIFEQFKNNRIDAATTNTTRNLELGTINLPTTTHSDTKVYKVILNYNAHNGQHIYEIIPSSSQDSSYPSVGTKGGKNGDGSSLHGYRLSMTYTTTGPEIESFMPF